MYEFFPGMYPWNLATYLALEMGGVLSEIESVSQPLAQYKTPTDPGAWDAWMAAWQEIGARVGERAMVDRGAGHHRTAGKKFLRASLYYFMAERMLRVGDPRRLPLYQRALEHFRRGIEARSEPVEFVEVPYGDTSLPALLVHPKTAPLGGAPGPCMVFLDGFDVMKEMLYFGGVRPELTERGIALLLVDHPGVGETLRLRNLPAIPEMERTGTACMDYLLGRTEIDPRRIGIMGVSLGGYYAPRAAAFEKRFACCVAWGGSNRFGARIDDALHARNKAVSVTDMIEHARWVFGAADNDALVATARRLTLNGVADKITCPLLITHGENDRQVPVSEAQETYDMAINSPLRELKVFTRAEGGVEHVNFDNPGVVIDYMADWIVARLGPRAT